MRTADNPKGPLAMEQQQLEYILKTTKGLEAVTRLLASLHYAPTIIEGFFNPKYDPYTTKLRAFVRQVRSAIPYSDHAEHSRIYLDAVAEDSGNDLEEFQHIAEKLEAEIERTKAIEKLEDLCQQLLTDPPPKEP